MVLGTRGTRRLADVPGVRGRDQYGLVPYRDFAVEYPPGSLPAFVLPSLLGGDYATTFAWSMAACGVALVSVVALARPRAALYVALAPVLTGSLILSRFDLWPALLTAAHLSRCSESGIGSAGRFSERRSRRSCGRS